MANKPSYSQAHKMRKGTATMTVEPMPKTFSDTELEPPKKSGDPTTGISSEPNATPGVKAEHAIAHPGDTAHPNDLTKV